MRGRLAVRIASVAALALAAVTPATGCTTAASEAPWPTRPRAVAEEVVAALKSKDGEGLGELVHPRKGVRFSPYASVDTSSDVVLDPAQAAQLWDDPAVRTWGTADGSGEPIVMTGAGYWREYVWDRDYTKASSVQVNQDRASGNTVNNVRDAYPDAARVEYYIEAKPVNGRPGNDWTALRIVLEKVGDSYYLVGVIHDEWTI